MLVMQLEIKGTVYNLSQKPADRWGELRYNLSKEGQEKPYSMSVSSHLYKDSAIPGYGCSCKGWIYYRKCKHIEALRVIVDSQVAA